MVLGATGDTGTIAHLGSTLLAVTAHAEGAVVVVRGDPDADGVIRGVGPVVLGVDDDPACADAIGAAFAEADTRGAELVAVHCRNDWAFAGFDDTSAEPEEDTADSALADRLAPSQRTFPQVRVTRLVKTAEPAHYLSARSEDAQLIVIGSRGRGGFVGLLFGSTVNTLVQHAACPVMVVHPATGARPRTTDGDDADAPARSTVASRSHADDTQRGRE